MSIAKVQHYVPQFLLKQFGTGKKDKISVFDKQTDRTFATNVRNVAAESRFYDFTIAGRSESIEPGLSEMEGLAKRVIDKILSADSLNVLSDEDRGVLSLFCAVQLARTKGFREQFRSFPTLLKERMLSQGMREEDLKNIEPELREPNDNELALMCADFISKEGGEFAMLFAIKDWLLLATDQRDPFIIGDNPITRQNAMPIPGPYGKLGLAVRGIEIYCPLSPVRALGMWCPSLRETIEAKIREVEQANPIVVQALAPRIARIKKLAEAFKSEGPLQYSAENVMNFNSLQINHAERYVFASNDEAFGLAKRMIKDREAYRKGPRMKVN
jgi:hypothetical protein